MKDFWQYEQLEQMAGHQLIAGVDEAGRGPLAGPVFAAAVILPFGIEIEGLNDSKKLSEKKREKLYDIICKEALSWAVYSCDEKEIDKINILQASLVAMKGALEQLAYKPDIALIDGNKCPQCAIPCKAIVKGDQKSASIAAASILAKVSRDRFMMEMAQKYPAYHFDGHKGYPTKEHRELVLQLGPCEIHRKTFLKKVLKG
jgi:ribonuclease HII